MIVVAAGICGPKGVDVEPAAHTVLLRLTGGGTFLFNDWGYLSASAPFVVLTVQDDGVNLGLRWGKWAKRAPRFDWCGLVDVQLSRKTVSWHDHERFFYRFVTLVDGSMDLLADVLDQHSVPYEIVRATWMRPLTMN
jgi:hypothetical protein